MKSSLSMLMVTHDRYFLERVCTRIIELNRGKIYIYEGSYSDFLEARQERIETDHKNRDRARNLLRREFDWINRQPRARGGKAKHRIDKYQELTHKADKILESKKLDIPFSASRLGKKIIELDNISKSYSSNIIFSEFSYKFQKKDRLGITGPNGSGKSTFLNVITGQLATDTGSVSIGETIKIGYYMQKGMDFDNDLNLLDTVRSVSDSIKLSENRIYDAAQMLERFLFSRDIHDQPVRKLSGGEKRRLYLLMVLMDNPNFLIMDEPTNDLDILTLNILEEFLEEFEGCLAVVSHDRYFLDKVCTHLFVFSNESPVIKESYGGWTDWSMSMDAQDVNKDKASITSDIHKTKSIVKPVKKSRPGLNWREQKELKDLEEQIDSYEKKQKEIHNFISSGPADYKELVKATTDLTEIEKSLDTMTSRWLELQEKEEYSRK
jgi:ATP-binding cassette subfamily F protein uup